MTINEHHSSISPRVSNDFQSDEIKIIEDPLFKPSKKIQQQQSLDAVIPQSFHENLSEISSMSASSAKLTKKFDQREIIEISEGKEGIPSINEACFKLNEVNKPSK